jgi:hypothetical protein
MTKAKEVTARNIDTCALLVETSISVWTARKLDRGVTDEVLLSKHAGSKGAARVNKHLLSDRPELENIQKHANAARTYLYTHTLPWSNSGLRLLPTAEFMKFNDRMLTFEDEFDKLVNEFVEIYPTLITAQAMAMGDMFNRDDYPHADAMRRKFSFRVSYMPVPAAGDFRVDVGLEAQQELREQLEKIGDERVKMAVADIKARLGEHLERMSDRLTIDVDKDGKETPRRFHASLIDGAYELCDLVRSLNIVMDVDLEKARVGLVDALKTYTADDLRQSPAMRESVKAGVDKVLEQFVWEKQ